VLKEWGGQLIEPPYTKGISSTLLTRATQEIGTTPEIRLERFRRLITSKPLIRVLEAHNGITGLIVDRTQIQVHGKLEEFDAIWLSSLTDSTAKGKPDTEYVDLTSRLQTIHDVLDITTKPLILDGDTGGPIEHFGLKIKALERIGVSAIAIEDKVSPKINSLVDGDHQQLDINDFAHKISIGKQAQITDHFAIIARIESLILRKGVEDAVKRARAYIDAGADAILIHSKANSPSEIYEFCYAYKKLDQSVPLVAVPTRYPQVSERELTQAGIRIVIYANHLLRSAYSAMERTACLILEHSRGLEAETMCVPVDEILGLVSKK
jgi:phosphoenolpyruvate phosphomutase